MYDILGDKYTVNLSISDAESDGNILYESNITDLWTVQSTSWHRYVQSLELGHQKMNEDLWFNIDISGEKGGITMANHELFFEVWIPHVPFSWGTDECSSDYSLDEIESLDVDLQIGMQFDVAIWLPWIEQGTLIEGYSDFYIIKSQYDFENENCQLPENFYDCFSGVERIINASRWPYFTY